MHISPMEADRKMSAGSSCCFGLLSLLAQILLHGAIALTLFWVIQYRWDGEGLPFAWRGTKEGDLEKEWNLHPVLMMTGFIYCMGQAMLMYRSCRCCRQIWSKLLHTMFHMLGIPCVVLGFIAAWDYHSLRKDKEGNSDPIPHFYSIHSWLGLVTMGLAILQFLVGVASFLLLLCCQTATSKFRAAMVPLHSTVGTTTFMLAIATAIAGITETAFFKLSSEGSDSTGKMVISVLGEKYLNLSEEAIFLNTIGAVLIALAIIIPAMLGWEGFRKGLPREGGRNTRA